MEMLVTKCTNAPSGNNQVLTLKAGFDVRPNHMGIGFTSIQFNYSAAPKDDFWKNSAAGGEEYMVVITKLTKS